jgi:shikimate dehydrogenase
LTISGSTRVAGVIGDPVRHSLSPVLHNAAYGELGLDWVYAAFEVPAGSTGAALEAMRALGLAGLSITMPHKTAAAECCDVLAPDAAALQSVNTVQVDEQGRLAGDSTDGEGFLRSLREAGHDPAGAPALVLGGGGAARAVALALGRAGALVTVCARKPDAAAAAARLAGGDAASWDERGVVARRCVLVVNATPVGMATSGHAPAAAPNAPDVPIPEDALRSGQVCADLVYHPRQTPLLRIARRRGAATVDGLGMLVHQAALQIDAWTGRSAPIAAMRAAAEAALARAESDRPD